LSDVSYVLDETSSSESVSNPNSYAPPTEISPPVQNSSHTADSSKEHLLQQFVELIAEVQHTFAMSGIATNVANAMVDPNSVSPKADFLYQYTPKPTPKLLDEAYRVGQMSHGKGVGDALRKFLNRLRATDPANLGTGALTRRSSGPASRSLLELAESGQLACKTALAVMTRIDAMGRHYNVDLTTTDDWTDLQALLTDSAAGGHARVSVDGLVSVPDWISVSRESTARSTKRLKLRAEVTLFNSAGVQQNVILRDMSSLGMAIEGAQGVKPEDEVMMRLPTGEEVIGTIRWIKGTKAGIQLAAELLEQLRA
jgi:PilZ domain